MKDVDNKQNFIAVGDWDCNSHTKKTVKMIKQQNPEIILGLGDYSYGNNVKCWLKIIEPINENLKISLGNHDTISSKMLKDYMTKFNLEKQYYSFNHKNIHFLALSTEVPYDKDSKQYQFVIKDLEKYSSDPFIDWTIVFFHRHMYGTGSSPGDETEFRNIYHPLFDKYNVNLVFQGHQHVYERTFPLEFNHDKKNKPIITKTSSNLYDKDDGVIFITVGTGGANLGKLSKSKDFTVTRDNEFGILNIDILKNGKSLNGVFYDHDGNILDEFVLEK